MRFCWVKYELLVHNQLVLRFSFVIVVSALGACVLSIFLDFLPFVATPRYIYKFHMFTTLCFFSLRTTILGKEVGSPICIAPTALQVNLNQMSTDGPLRCIIYHCYNMSALSFTFT